MAIDRPGAIEPHPRRSRRAGAQRRTAGRTLFCLARGMPSAGVPASCAGWPGRGKKWTGRRCGQTIEAQPALGQIRPSEVRVARPGTSTGRVAAMGCETQEDERTERGKTCTGASTAARQAREDTASLTLGVARNECGRGATARIHGRSQSSEDALTHDPSRVCGDVRIRRTYLRRARGRELNRRRPNGYARCRAAQQRPPRPRTRVRRQSVAACMKPTRPTRRDKGVAAAALTRRRFCGSRTGGCRACGLCQRGCR